MTVGKALAVAQPQGALVHYASEHKKMATIGSEQSLIIDPGSRTFDWLVARGMRLVQKQSHSFNRGMSDVLRILAAEIHTLPGTLVLDRFYVVDDHYGDKEPPAERICTADALREREERRRPAFRSESVSPWE